MGDVAKRRGKQCGNENAGTIEFLIDQNAKFYFIEMNRHIPVSKSMQNLSSTSSKVVSLLKTRNIFLDPIPAKLRDGTRSREMISSWTAALMEAITVRDRMTV
jgi:hypothetical protein